MESSRGDNTTAPTALFDSAEASGSGMLLEYLVTVRILRTTETLLRRAMVRT